jgi:preprotein translocase subunit SecF
MTTTTESPDINSATARRPRHRAIAVIVGGAATIALLAFFGTTGAGAAETTVASGPVQLVDQESTAPLRVQDVDDDDQDQTQENNAIQSMIQSEQQAEEQNEQAQQQALQDELQAQQTEQEAGQ